MPYFGAEPVGRVKIQTTSKNSQRYYTTKRLIRDLLSNTPNCYVRELREYFIYGRMRDRSMRSGTKLAREIQLTDWSAAGNPSNRSSRVQIPRDICTRFGRYLYSTKCSWIIKGNTGEYKGIQENTGEYRRIQENIREYKRIRKIQGNTRECREIH